MRLAYFSPLNPQRSGISDYSEELLAALLGGAEIELFVDGFEPSTKAITERFQIHDYRKSPEVLAGLDGYDAILCQMGNSHRYHRGIYEVASTNSAIIVFHDFALQNFFLERSRELKDANAYLDELDTGSESLKTRAQAEEALTRGSAPPQYHNPLAFPMNSRLANQAEGIIVHSEWSRSRLARIAPGVPITKINLHVSSASHAPRPDDAVGESVSIASFGFITGSKGLESALRALAALKPSHNFQYYLVGEPNKYFDVEELTRLYDISDRVSITGYVSLDEFNRKIAKTDIAINLRDQTVGETSASLCRLMAAGVPTIVSNIGWFSELPDDCVIKIDPGPDVDLLIGAYLKELMENPELRRSIGANARRLMLSGHKVEQTAHAYLNFIDHVIARRAHRKFIESISSEVASLSSVEPDELLLKGIAPAISELTLATESQRH